MGREIRKQGVERRGGEGGGHDEQGETLWLTRVHISSGVGLLASLSWLCWENLDLCPQR